MGKGFTGAILTVMGVKSHIATTTGKTVINDRMVTIHFHSEMLLNTEGEVPGDWLRLWFPHESRPGKLYQRAYTLTNVDADAGTFDLAFVLHEPLGARLGVGDALRGRGKPGSHALPRNSVRHPRSSAAWLPFLRRSHLLPSDLLDSGDLGR